MENSSDCYLSLEHSVTNSFSKLVLDYLKGNENLSSFISFEPNLDGFKNAIRERNFNNKHRTILVEVLNEQYNDLSNIELVSQNIKRLSESNTFTITTAHQPNLLGGPLYFIYKILHAVKLAEYLSDQFTNNNFVPIYYIGSEDNDLDELGHFYFYDHQYNWLTDQTGAVGRMSTNDLRSLLEEFFSKMGPSGESLQKLQEIITLAFSNGHTIAKATQIFVHELLGPFGIVVLDPDDVRLKNIFSPIIRDEVLNHSAAGIVRKTTERLDKYYKSQAFIRDINLFYLKDNLRERIIKKEDQWAVLNTEIKFSEDEILAEISNHPERFSPNVILRGLFQETILPNIGFVGGGAEVAYWMQLKELFSYYKIDFPILILRQSFLLINPATKAQIDKINLPNTFIFEDPAKIIEKIAIENNENLFFKEEQDSMNKILLKLKDRAKSIDITLEASAEAVNEKISKQLLVLSKKILRAEKKKYEIIENRLFGIRQNLYPKGVMQERKVSFMEYYLNYGDDIFRIIYDGIFPFGDKFQICFMPKN